MNYIKILWKTIFLILGVIVFIVLYIYKIDTLLLLFYLW